MPAPCQHETSKPMENKLSIGKVEMLHTQEVAGSSPAAPTSNPSFFNASFEGAKREVVSDPLPLGQFRPDSASHLPATSTEVC